MDNFIVVHMMLELIELEILECNVGINLIAKNKK